jgi:hypothetical protein
VALAVSPTLSLTNPAAELSVMVTVSLHSPLCKGQSITLCTKKNIFHVYSKGDGGVDMFARGAFGLLQSINGDTSKNISLGLFRLNERDVDDSPDLRERGFRLITILGKGSSVTITDRLDILRYYLRRWFGV